MKRTGLAQAILALICLASLLPKAVICGNGSGEGLGDPAAAESPFGVFGPYQFVLDSREVANCDVINAYLADLGVKWVQEMPVGIDRVPRNLRVVSRVGREKGTVPPHVDYKIYIPALRETIARNRDRVKYWEIDTEPGGLPPPRGWKGYEKEYAEFLKESSKAIKAECPDCRVILGGTAGIGGGPRTDPNADFVREILGYQTAGFFEVFSFKLHHHKAADYTDLKNKLAIFRDVFSGHGLNLDQKELFLETAVYDGNPGYDLGHPLSRVVLPVQSEFQQAVALVKTYVFALAQGVDRIFWNEILERRHFGGERRNPFNFYGLVNNPLNEDGRSHKKLAYFTYKKMVEVLEESDWSHITCLREEKGVYLYRFVRRGKPVIVGWYDGSGNFQVEIDGFNPGRIQVTVAVPSGFSGQNVSDYGKAFRKIVLNSRTSSWKLTLGEDGPVYIEGME